MLCLLGWCTLRLYSSATGLDGLLVTAWSIHPRRLGLVFCQQRVSVILHLPFYPIGGEKRGTHSRSPAAQSTRLSQFCRKIPTTLNHITVSADRVRRCSPLGDIASSAQFSPDGKRLVSEQLAAEFGSASQRQLAVVSAR